MDAGSTVTWADGVEQSVPRSVRASWEAHLFHPGDRVALARHGAAEVNPGRRQLIEFADRQGIRNFLVTRTVVSVRPCDGIASPRASYALAECDGLWPHDMFIDPRPLIRLIGAIITLGPATWLVPTEAGAPTRRDRAHDPVLLAALIERRARHALGTSRARDLDGVLGEFLVGTNARRASPLIAAYWTSPLGADEDGILRASLAAEKARAEERTPGGALRAGHAPPLRQRWIASRRDIG